MSATMDFTKKFIFIDYKASFPLLEEYDKKYKKLKGELEQIADCQASVLVRLFLTSQTVPFKPNETTLLALLRSSVALIRQNALYCFDSYYANDIDSLSNHNFWISGSVENYKLADIRKVLKEKESKAVTRLSKNVDFLVVGEKCKLDVLPPDVKVASTLSFITLLDAPDEVEVLEEENIDETEESLLVEKLLEANADELLVLFEGIGKEELVEDVLALILGMYKVHPEKNIRVEAKKILEGASSKCTKELLNFCEARNFLNAKYTVGMEEMEKIKGFNIDLFLYYLVKVQKNHLGKEYLARLDSHWTERFLEESTLLNQEQVELFGKAGERFVFAKDIENFTVHATSPVVWKMDWLKRLEIIEKKEVIVLPKENMLYLLDTLVLESKELKLAGELAIKILDIKKCKTLEIAENFSVESLEKLSFEGCSFNMQGLKSFFEKSSFPNLKHLSFKRFANYKVPKGWEDFLKEKFPNAEIEV